uniref:Fibronectin type-III domain-containing protein n=1 Tax=Hucho hucho TaxID=62062 RepID=A0A4W5QJM0_9TELE
MTPVIWMVTWLLQAHSAMCDLPAPVNVTLSSRHFVHQLRWHPGPGSPSGVYYRVKVNSNRYVGDNHSWKEVAGCEHVESPLVCNLTKEFSSHSHTYYNQVFAVSGKKVSSPANQSGFTPIADTLLDPPVVSVKACGSTLCVGLRPPVDRLWDVYDTFRYNLSIRSSSSSSKHYYVKKNSLKEEVLKNLAPGREYCVSVRIVGSGERRNKDSSYSQPHCAFTAAKYTAGTLSMVLFCDTCLTTHLLTSRMISASSLQRSVQHHEENLHPVPCDEEPFPSVRLVPPSPPSESTGKDGENEEESEAETSSGGGQGYKTRGITADLTSHNPLSSSSRTEVFLHPYRNTHSTAYPTATSTDTQTTAETQSNRPHVPLFITCDQQPESLLRPDRLSMSLSRPSQTSQLPEPAQCASRGQDLSFSLSSERDTGNAEGLHLEEEESCLDVNLLSVTLGRHEEMKRQREMMEPEHLSLGEPPEPSTPFLPSDTKCWATEPAITQMHTATSEVEEEGDDEYSGYMRR